MSASVIRTGERAALASRVAVAAVPVAALEAPVAAVPLAEAEERASSPDRLTVLRGRRTARRLRRLYALGSLAVLAAFLVATIVVVDMIR